MTTPPASTTPAPAVSHYSSAYLEIERFIFNPTLVTGCLHRPATNEESVGVTEVLYGSHHLIVEDRQQHLFYHLRHHLAPKASQTTV